MPQSVLKMPLGNVARVTARQKTRGSIQTHEVSKTPSITITASHTQAVVDQAVHFDSRLKNTGKARPRIECAESVVWYYSDPGRLRSYDLNDKIRRAYDAGYTMYADRDKEVGCEASHAWTTSGDRSVFAVYFHRERDGTVVPYVSNSITISVKTAEDLVDVGQHYFVSHADGTWPDAPEGANLIDRDNIPRDLCTGPSTVWHYPAGEEVPQFHAVANPDKGEVFVAKTYGPGTGPVRFPQRRSERDPFSFYGQSYEECVIVISDVHLPGRLRADNQKITEDFNYLDLREIGYEVKHDGAHITYTRCKFESLRLGITNAGMRSVTFFESHVFGVIDYVMLHSPAILCIRGSVIENIEFIDAARYTSPLVDGRAGDEGTTKHAGFRGSSTDRGAWVHSASYIDQITGWSGANSVKEGTSVRTYIDDGEEKQVLATAHQPATRFGTDRVQMPRAKFSHCLGEGGESYSSMTEAVNPLMIFCPVSAALVGIVHMKTANGGPNPVNFAGSKGAGYFSCLGLIPYGNQEIHYDHTFLHHYDEGPFERQDALYYKNAWDCIARCTGQYVGFDPADNWGGDDDHTISNAESVKWSACHAPYSGTDHGSFSVVCDLGEPRYKGLMSNISASVDADGYPILDTNYAVPRYAKDGTTPNYAITEPDSGNDLYGMSVSGKDRHLLPVFDMKMRMRNPDGFCGWPSDPLASAYDLDQHYS